MTNTVARILTPYLHKKGFVHSLEPFIFMSARPLSAKCGEKKETYLVGKINRQ